MNLPVMTDPKKLAAQRLPSLLFSYMYKICLLEAELAALGGDIDAALEKFVMSIALLQRDSLLHDQALGLRKGVSVSEKAGQGGGSRAIP